MYMELDVIFIYIYIINNLVTLTKCHILYVVANVSTNKFLGIVCKKTFLGITNLNGVKGYQWERFEIYHSGWQLSSRLL